MYSIQGNVVLLLNYSLYLPVTVFIVIVLLLLPFRNSCELWLCTSLHLRTRTPLHYICVSPMRECEVSMSFMIHLVQIRYLQTYSSHPGVGCDTG